VWVLVAAVVVLLAGVTVISVAGFGHIGRLHDEASKLRGERDNDTRAASDATAKQKADLQTADLDGKLKKVRDLDAAADDAFTKWNAGTTKFGVLDDAMDRCDDAIDAYNRAAAPFPVDLLGSLPKRIDIREESTDCGRSFTSRI
jgi:hypothetical protein